MRPEGGTHNNTAPKTLKIPHGIDQHSGQGP